MHKFDPQRALAGEPLITRDGQTDIRLVEQQDFNYSSFPLKFSVSGYEFWYRLDGTICIGEGDEADDLFMLHETSGDTSDSSATADSTTSIATGTPVESGFSSWQPIETLDKERMQFLLAFEDGAIRTMLWNPIGFWERPDPVGCADRGFTPSHWMPLPAPPTA